MEVHKQVITDDPPGETWIEIECKGPWVRVHSSATAYSPDWERVTCERCLAKRPKTLK